MPIIGFSFGKDLVRLGYPVVQSVRSVLPICDRFVFVVGKSDDGTRELVASIDPRKVEIVDSEWPDVKVDGTVLSIEANKALDAATPAPAPAPGSKSWGFYIQADEVVHEDDLPKIKAACERWAEHDQVKALLFRYLHFVMDYQTTDPWMYHKASRIVRLDGSCRIIGDACGPAMTGYSGNVGNRDGYLDKNFLGTYVQWATPAPGSKDSARIFHYGWVKTRAQLDAKLDMVRQLWWGTLDDAERRRRETHKFGKFMERYPILKNYRGTHPAVMRELIAQHPQYRPGRNRWLNPRFYAEALRHGFHG
ncbi:MAG: hypothetical protein WC058_14105 [Phycisphaeraceae bacterium]